MWAFFLSGVGRWIAASLVGVLAIGGLYAKGRYDGNQACKATQAQQMAKMEAYVRAVRERIERGMPLDSDDILRADPFQRQP